MDKYYYLISSLPLLKFAKEPYITQKDFIVEAEKWLSQRDLIILSRVDINNFLEDKEDTSLLGRWKEFEHCLRNELALFRRARKENREYRLRGDLARIAQGDSNPLEIEKRLLLLRWDFLDEYEFEHFFDLDFLIIYYLKLQILGRLASFDKEKGKAVFVANSSVEL
jgi:hypothetical protein